MRSDSRGVFHKIYQRCITAASVVDHTNLPCCKAGSVPSERGMEFVVCHVRYNSWREIRLQVLVEEALTVRFRFPDLDQAYAARRTWPSGMRYKAFR